MTASTTLLVLLAGTVLVALAGFAWRSLHPASLTFGTADARRGGADRREGEDRRVNDPALPHVGEGHERRQITRRRGNV